mgnify:CR=1 FL=1
MLLQITMRILRTRISYPRQNHFSYRLHRILDQLLKLLSYISIKSRSGLPVPTHSIWAETAATFFIEKEPILRQAIAHSTPKGGLTITGALRKKQGEDDTYKVWNSMHGIDDVGNIVGTYDKSHLVPFGEYAIAGFQDLDGNGVLTGNFLGIPKEPVGFSGDAKIRFGPPKWNDAVFKFKEIDQKVLIYLDKI